MSHPPPNFYAWFLQRGFTAIFVPPNTRGSAHSSSDWSLGCFHWGGRAWVQLSVFWLMDGLSDFIWAGRTLLGWGPEIVTPDCFIRVWLWELSSCWSKVPRQLVQSPPSLLSFRDLGLPTSFTGMTPASYPCWDRYINQLPLIHLLWGIIRPLLRACLSPSAINSRKGKDVLTLDINPIYFMSNSYTLTRNDFTLFLLALPMSLVLRTTHYKT